MASTADVLIVGAGIIGASIASSLARRGTSVLILDPAPASGSSLGNAGLVVPSYATPMSTPANLKEGVTSLRSDHSAVTFGRPLTAATLSWLPRFAAQCRPGRVARDTKILVESAQRSMELYKKLAAEDGLNLGLREQGWLWLATQPNTRQALPTVMKALSQAGGKGRVVTRAEALEIEPGLSPDIEGGIWFPHEGVLDPEKATRIFLQDACQHGAQLLRESVQSVERHGNFIAAVHTNRQRLQAKQLVMATGAASREAGKLFGISVPIEPGYGWSLTFADPQGSLQRPLMGMEDHVVVSPIPGRIRLTGGMQFGGKKLTHPPQREIQRLVDATRRFFPTLEELELETTWFGARPMTPSGVPVVKRIKGSNLVVAAGHGPLGVTLAPSTAQDVTNMLLVES